MNSPGQSASTERTKTGRRDKPAEAGRSTATRNAVTHGATRAPSSELVLKLLSVILNKPSVTPDALLPSDERGAKALNLAMAEARLVQAQAALQEFAAETADPSPEALELREMVEDLMDVFVEDDNTPKQTREFKSIMRRLMKFDAHETKLGGKRHRLLKRYLREAQTGRTRALKNWVRVNAGAA